MAAHARHLLHPHVHRGGADGDVHSVRPGAHRPLGLRHLTGPRGRGRGGGGRARPAPLPLRGIGGSQDDLHPPIGLPVLIGIIGHARLALALPGRLHRPLRQIDQLLQTVRHRPGPLLGQGLIVGVVGHIIRMTRDRQAPARGEPLDLLHRRGQHRIRLTAQLGRVRREGDIAADRHRRRRAVLPGVRRAVRHEGRGPDAVGPRLSRIRIGSRQRLCDIESGLGLPHHGNTRHHAEMGQEDLHRPSILGHRPENREQLYALTRGDALAERMSISADHRIHGGARQGQQLDLANNIRGIGRREDPSAQGGRALGHRREGQAQNRHAVPHHRRARLQIPLHTGAAAAKTRSARSARRGGRTGTGGRVRTAPAALRRTSGAGAQHGPARHHDGTHQNRPARYGPHDKNSLPERECG